MRAILITLLALTSVAPAQQPAPKPAQPLVQPTVQNPGPWPTQDHVYKIPNFKFNSGETLPELKLHYLTLGTPHRNAAGHIDNAVLLLHGTGGFAGNLL